MPITLDALRLFAAKSWHRINYPRYRKKQKLLINDAIRYISSIPGEKNDSISLNTLAGRRFIKEPEWKEIHQVMAGESPLEHRKYWEYTQAVYGLSKLGMLGENRDLLGVASGHEAPLYYLSNHCRSVTATDIYDGFFAVEKDGEANPEVLAEPDKYAPFAYRKDKLKFMRMNALELKFPDNSFDAVFSLSSVEHFGGEEQYGRAMKEMARVIKPGGIVAITTEFSLNGSDYRGYFNGELLEKYLIKPSGLKLVEPVNFYVEPDLYEFVRIMPIEIKKRPHFLLQIGNVLFTSVSLFLRKE
ncbi:MAG: class I SAM-dependent methyltransferase [Firmicutes bacterium]|nr:class I SAM-dependent methyltransferase [Bacillota bacterium]